MGSQNSLPRPFFITATDTGAGKTHLALRWLRWLSAYGTPGTVYKPIATGGGAEEGSWHPNGDLMRLSEASDKNPFELSFVYFELAMAPQLAAEDLGISIPRDALVDWCKERICPGAAIEGIGGLLVPVCTGYRVIHLIQDLAISPVLVTRTSLGTINSTLLSIQAMRVAGIPPVAVVASNISNETDESWELAKRHIQESIFPIPLLELPHVDWKAPLTEAESRTLGALAVLLTESGN